MPLLAFDTVAPVIGVALAADGAVRERTARIARGAEALLVPWARELAAEAGIALSDLDGIVVANGPGAFTGVRVGLATASGLALALGLPLVPVMSLASRAAAQTEPVLALLDARKGRAYAAWYAGGLAEGPADVDPETAIAWATPPFVATGEGAVVWRAAIEAAGGRVAADAAVPALRWLVHLGAAALARGEGTDPTSIAPLYLRPPDAVPQERSR
jgi:tRNA threonylcarbamoyladenosine biosynthesis protein TsaB